MTEVPLRDRKIHADLMDELQFESWEKPTEGLDVRTVIGALVAPKDQDTHLVTAGLLQKLEDAIPAAVGDSYCCLVDSEIDTSDDATGEDAEGNTINAFLAGQRCYRVILRLVPDQPGLPQ